MIFFCESGHKISLGGDREVMGEVVEWERVIKTYYMKIIK